MYNHKLSTLILLCLAFFATSCGGGSSESETVAEAPKTPMTLEEAEKGWKTNNGVGPIKSLDLPAEIDQAMVDAGKVVYEAKCTACHKIEKRFIGPSPKGIMGRRTAAWVMNMILDPEAMVKEDPIARQLLMKFSAPMANQSLTEEEARSVLEYFRTL
ncbi:MAG: cytochrome c [Cyclobacteriaceae bacterium]|nr:cytochrome c [Cyclobacteriaceae bacterium]